MGGDKNGRWRRIHEQKKIESFERINAIRETKGNFDFPFVSRIEFIRSKLSNFSDHVSGARGDTLYSFEVAVAPSMLKSASPVRILHPQYMYPKASQNR